MVCHTGNSHHSFTLNNIDMAVCANCNRLTTINALFTTTETCLLDALTFSVCPLW